MEDGGPSITARRVAAHRLGFARVPAPYGDPAADDALATDVAAGREAPLNRMHDYLAARTSFFDRMVVAAIGRGVRQIVVGAAGYDGRALRYAKPGVRWFEVDHPATQRDKRGRLERLGISAPQVRFVEADFTRDPLAERLLAAGLDPGAPSLFLLEGIAVYLEPAVLETVLDQLREVAAPGSRLVISVSLSRDHDEDSRARFQASVAAMGEPAKSTFDADEAEDLLARCGWQIMASRGDPDDSQTAAKRQRQHSAGLLVASADPRAPAGAGQQPSSGQQPNPERSAGRPTRTSGSRPAVPVPQSPGTLPLPALLSQCLVAFTIEFDNEAEHRLPHHTTNFGAGSQGDGAWLVSLAMWENCMRFVTDEPITVAELETLARTGTNLDGMRRWGYVTIDGTAKKVHKARPGPDAVLRATAQGLRARQVWLPLAGLIEERWRERFGAGQLGLLRDSLIQLVDQLDPGLPDCLPILGPALLSRGPDPALPPRPDPIDLAGLPLSALLSRALLSFALAYEGESELSLAIGANLLRVLDGEGTRLRDLPPLAGISKEAASWAMGVLVRSRLAVEAPHPGPGRGKIARLTSAGIAAQGVYRELVGTVEQRWRERYADGTVSALRQVLEALATAPDDQPPPLFGALEPYPDNWRAQVRPPHILPHYPMVLHRGGYPDGS